MLTVEKRKNVELLGNEIAIIELHVPYTIVYQHDNQATLDMHIKTKDAIKLFKGLEKVLKNQVVSPSVDR